MNIYLDTSSLFKLYHKENGTEELEDFFNNQQIERVFLAELAKIEFASVVWRKCRMKEIDFDKANLVLAGFSHDHHKFLFVPDSNIVKEWAVSFISTYWQSGLRTLDSIQLASALTIKEKVDLFQTSDLVLQKLAEKEGFYTILNG